MTTLSLAQYDEILSLLEGCSEYFEKRASAEYFTDSPDPCGNEEMHMLAEVGYAIRELRLAHTQGCGPMTAHNHPVARARASSPTPPSDGDEK